MLEIYTDGACSPNPGLGGWAAIFVLDGKVMDEIYGYVEDTTNNRMELLAVIKALEWCGDTNVKMFSDSGYVVNTLTKGWAKNKNIDLWARLDSLTKYRNIEWIWVKGHASNAYNSRCDELAVKARINKITNFED